MGKSASSSWPLREWLSRLLVGATAGCLALCLFCLLVLDPLLGPTVKGKHLWTLRIPEYGLPAVIILGGLAGVVWRRARQVRLSRSWLLGFCLAIALMVQFLRPTISRIPSKGFGPLYEEVPDTLAMIFCVIGLLVLAYDRGIGPSGEKVPDSQSSLFSPFATEGAG